jgi:hypothetical protein
VLIFLTCVLLQGGMLARPVIPNGPNGLNREDEGEKENEQTIDTETYRRRTLSSAGKSVWLRSRRQFNPSRCDGCAYEKLAVLGLLQRCSKG